MFTCNSTKLTSVPIIAYNSNVHFVRNDPFSHLRSHMMPMGVGALMYVCLSVVYDVHMSMSISHVRALTLWGP